MIESILLLLRCLLFFLLLGPSLASTFVTCVGTRNTECPVCLEVALLGGDFSWGFRGIDGGERKRITGNLRLEVLHGGITLLGLAGLAGEHNQAGLVLFEPLHVNFLALLTQICPPVVDNDTNTACFLPSDPSLLELSKGESTALTDFAIIANGLTADGRAQRGYRANTKAGSLSFAGIASAELAPWLVKPGADTALPVLAVMIIVQDIVVRETHVLSCKISQGQVECE